MAIMGSLESFFYCLPFSHVHSSQLQRFILVPSVYTDQLTCSATLVLVNNATVHAATSYEEDCPSVNRVMPESV